MRAAARGGGRRNAPNQAALLDGVAETVLAQLKVDSADPDRATPLALRPLGTPRPLEAVPTLLTSAGFSGTRPGRRAAPDQARRDAPARPELLITAKTQRRVPEELLRSLIDAELAARDASNARTRSKNAAFPVIKTRRARTRSSLPAGGPGSRGGPADDLNRAGRHVAAAVLAREGVRGTVGECQQRECLSLLAPGARERAGGEIGD
jgi:hypothetical protein